MRLAVAMFMYAPFGMCVGFKFGYVAAIQRLNAADSKSSLGVRIGAPSSHGLHNAQPPLSQRRFVELVFYATRNLALSAV
jgi:hypothetical protein